MAKSFTKFFDVDELQTMMDRKADIEIVKLMTDSKASSDDLLNVKGMIES